MLLVLFVVILVISVFSQSISTKNQLRLCLLFCVFLAYIAGTRDIYSWADTDVYYLNFIEYTNNIFSYNPDDLQYGFQEKGFHLIGVVVKTFSENAVVYFFVVAALSLFFILKSLQSYCLYPLLGLAVYIARFFSGRNMVQIRSGLAYAIIILGLKYIRLRDWKRYFLIVAIAFLFHRASIIAIPFYFLPYLKIKKVHVVILLIIAFIIAGFFSDFMQTFISDSITDLEMGETYIKGIEVTRAKGLANPLIYYQTMILLIYTFGEKRLKLIDRNYYNIRSSYLFSTFMLISLSMFLGLSGRTSTLFATLEIFILPELVLAVNKQLRPLAWIAICIGLAGIYYLNYQ